MQQNIKRIITFTGGIETLSFFSEQLRSTFQKMGYLVFPYDLKGDEKQFRRLKKFLKVGETAMLTFNFQGLGGEDYLFSKQYGYIWQQFKIPCYNIVVDHPFYYQDYMFQLPPEYHQISIDRYHEAYVKKYYKNVKTAGFLPHAGTQMIPEAEQLPIKERPLEVVMTGNYTSLAECEPYFHLINEEYAAFYHGIGDRMLKTRELPLEDVMHDMVTEEIGDVSDTQFAEVMNKARFIDLYLRCYTRGKCVSALVDQDIRVHVFGDGWEKLDCKKKQNLIITREISSEECLKKLGEAKISLSVMPWFRDGAHDRIFNSILNGALCVTDHSIYLDEIFTGDEVGFFDIGKLEELPDMVKELLADENRMQQMADEARKKVEKDHTWAARAAALRQLFEGQEMVV